MRDTGGRPGYAEARVITPGSSQSILEQAAAGLDLFQCPFSAFSVNTLWRIRPFLQKQPDVQDRMREMMIPIKV